jgi:glycosyltransferase involved in cell wall biosynthesis
MESFGLNWAEAMAAGIPIVASNVGSIPEYIKDNERGLLFPAGNHEALAHTVIRIFENERLAKHIAENGQQYALKNFGVDHATEKILGIYTQLLFKTSL